MLTLLAFSHFGQLICWLKYLHLRGDPCPFYEPWDSSSNPTGSKCLHFEWMLFHHRSIRTQAYQWEGIHSLAPTEIHNDRFGFVLDPTTSQFGHHIFSTDHKILCDALKSQWMGFCRKVNWDPSQSRLYKERLSHELSFFGQNVFSLSMRSRNVENINVDVSSWINTVNRQIDRWTWKQRGEFNSVNYSTKYIWPFGNFLKWIKILYIKMLKMSKKNLNLACVLLYCKFYFVQLSNFLQIEKKNQKVF